MATGLVRRTVGVLGCWEFDMGEGLMLAWRILHRTSTHLTMNTLLFLQAVKQLYLGWNVPCHLAHATQTCSASHTA